MKVIFQRVRRRLPRKLLPWAGLTLLLSLGLLTSVIDLMGVPASETRRANEVQQRVIIDPVTGVVSGLHDTTADSNEFEVAEEAPPAADEGAAPADDPAEPVAEEPIAEEPTTDTPAMEPADTGPATEMESLRREPADADMPHVARSRESLVGAPAPEITQKIGKLTVPMAGENHVRAASLYARGFTRAEDQPIVAIVVTDAGFSAESMAAMLALPREVSIGISPYAHDAAKQVEALRNQGHEVWAMLPAMTARYPQDDPGPLGLMTALDKKEALDHLYRILSATIGSVGVILPVDEAISTQPELWETVRDELVKRGLFILSTHPTRGIEQLSTDPAAQEQIRRADMILDSTPGASFIRSKLASVKENALAQKKLTVLVSARPQALKILGEWLADNSLQGSAVIAPLSAIYAPDTPPEPVAEEKPSHGGGH